MHRHIYLRLVYTSDVDDYNCTYIKRLLYYPIVTLYWLTTLEQTFMPTLPHTLPKSSFSFLPSSPITSLLAT